MNPLVMYKTGCVDSFGAAWAINDVVIDAEYLPVSANSINTLEDFAQIGVDCDSRDIYILGFSFPRSVMREIQTYANNVVWLDFHEESFMKQVGSYKKGMRFDLKTEGCHIVLDDSKSSSMIAWEYVHGQMTPPPLIQHISEYIRGQAVRDGIADKFINALASYAPWNFKQWDDFSRMAPAFDEWNDSQVVRSAQYHNFLYEGEAILRWNTQKIQELVSKSTSCIIVTPYEVGIHNHDHFRGLACNAPSFYSHDLGAELALKSNSYGMVWEAEANGMARVNLRSDGLVDVSLIAKCFNGEGDAMSASFLIELTTLFYWIY